MYDLPKYFSPEQSALAVFMSNMILAEIPIILVGPDQCGKTSLINAAMALLRGLATKETHVITANVNYAVFTERVLQNLRLTQHGYL